MGGAETARRDGSLLEGAALDLQGVPAPEKEPAPIESFRRRDAKYLGAVGVVGCFISFHFAMLWVRPIWRHAPPNYGSQVG